MEKINSIQKGTLLGKIGFGVIFMAAIPLLLMVWANATASLINLPVPANLPAIYLVLSIGILFVFFGMLHLWIFGKGLPMNAYPPKHFVMNGVYAIVKNPIYLGTILICFGIAALTKSSSGFWMVSPFFALMIIAYTVGFENERTAKIFGPQNYRPFLSLPEKTDERLTITERVSAYFLVFLPWLLIYEAFVFLCPPADAVHTNFAFENNFPVIEFSAVFYFSTYLFAALVPWVIKTKKSLYQFAQDVWLATGISALIYFTLPFIVKQQVFVPETFFGRMLLFDRSYDGESAAFPAFHVIWAFIAARYFSISIKKPKGLWYLLALLMSISSITTGSHSILDVLAGFSVFIFVFYIEQIWDFIRRQSEQLANSWKEWNFGSVRLINHGFYAGAAGFVGVLLVGFFLGSSYALAGFITGVCGIVGAALWAQFIEGSPKLQRPYGYYGSVVGVAIGSLLVVTIYPIHYFTLLVAYAMAAPWIQILGRLRCLVQGCCHGKPTNDKLGIRFTHPYSRVNKISGLPGASLHPTQLYSIGVNLISGIVLIRLMNIGMSATFIIGIYLILNGLGRFVEEFYRGESQTPYWVGMRVYQWIAILSILAGAIFTTIVTTVTLDVQWNMNALYWAMAMGLFATVAYGVDFPRSNKRFARLTSH